MIETVEDRLFFQKTYLGTCSKLRKALFTFLYSHRILKVVVGGSGYLGFKLVNKLCQLMELDLVEGVIVVDICKSIELDNLLKNPKVKFLNKGAGVGELESLDYWKVITKGTIFFVAACASTELCLKKAYQANVIGVQEALGIAQRYGTNAFVLTSTHNVVFNGSREIFKEDEPNQKKLILASNGIWNVHTCSLRPGGIYGPEERVHFERIRKLAKLGLLYFLISPVAPKNMDFVHVENLVDAHILAAQQLQYEASFSGPLGTSTSGQAFFITENDPQCLQTFYIPALLASGIHAPLFVVHIPRSVVYPFAKLSELVAKCFGIRPILMPMELMKATMTHTFTFEKANKAFGYFPRKSIEKGVEEWCRFEMNRQRQSSKSLQYIWK
eukprot:jgi/Galph1/616/GphlegSOOS_G5407.1